jgi:hypothetical protein
LRASEDAASVGRPAQPELLGRSDLFGAMALVFAFGLVTGRYGRVVRRPLGLRDRACGYRFGAGGVLFVVVGPAGKQAPL